MDKRKQTAYMRARTPPQKESVNFRSFPSPSMRWRVAVPRVRWLSVPAPVAVAALSVIICRGVLGLYGPGHSGFCGGVLALI